MAWRYRGGQFVYAQCMNVRFAIPMLATTMLLSACSNPQNWVRGNTHTHTLWSDGDAAPELAIAWYPENGYQFLVLTDHNTVQDHKRWFPVTEGGRLTDAHLDELRARFGPDAIELRMGEGGGREMRLKTLPELRAMFETWGFLLINGEEVTDSYARKPVHINALNIASVIEPRSGGSVAEVMQNTLDAVAAHAEEHGRPTLAHVNHPNFGWGIEPSDFFGLRGELFFEVYNGHRSVRNEGDEEHPSLEELWDTVLIARQSRGLSPLYALATDDAHNHRDPDGHSVPGRGWVMVRVEDLTASSVIESMKAGAFYASTGVTLEDVSRSDTQLSLAIRGEPGVTYTTEFIGAVYEEGSPAPIAGVLHTTTDNPARYTRTGEELYVRARVTSSEPHPRPYLEGDLQQAWTQPVWFEPVTD